MKLLLSLIKTALVVQVMLEFGSYDSHSCVSASPSPQQLEEPLSRVHRVAFGSCNSADKAGMWRVMEKVSRPDGLILLGDNMYADEKRGGLVFIGSNASNLQRQYRMLQENPEWQSLLKSMGPSTATANDDGSSRAHPALSATFDDHDYGINNGDKNYPLRNVSQSCFWDFLNEPRDSPRRLQSGVYSSKTVFLRPDFVYKIVLLDSRSNKDPHGTVNGDFLGQEQWSWLARELQDPVPNLILLGSSVQVLPQDKLLEEGWNDFPLARQRLLDLIGLETVAPNLVLLSGDVHTAEILQAKCRYVRGEDGQDTTEKITPLENDFRLFEFTSSGLSHTFSKTTRKVDYASAGAVSGSAAQLPEGQYVEELSKGLLFEVAYDMYVATGVAHSREFHYGDHYKGLHYGLIDFFLPPNGQAPSSLTVSIVDHHGKAVMFRTLPLKPKALEQSHARNSRDAKMKVDCQPFWGRVPTWRVSLARVSLLLIPTLFIAAPAVSASIFLCRLIFYVLKVKVKAKAKAS